MILSNCTPRDYSWSAKSSPDLKIRVNFISGLRSTLDSVYWVFPESEPSRNAPGALSPLLRIRRSLELSRSRTIRANLSERIIRENLSSERIMRENLSSERIIRANLLSERMIRANFSSERIMRENFSAPRVSLSKLTGWYPSTLKRGSNSSDNLLQFTIKIQGF